MNNYNDALSYSEGGRAKRFSNFANLHTVRWSRLNTAIHIVHRPHTTQVTACAFVTRQHGLGKQDGETEGGNCAGNQLNEEKRLRQPENFSVENDCGRVLRVSDRKEKDMSKERRFDRKKDRGAWPYCCCCRGSAGQTSHRYTDRGHLVPGGYLCTCVCVMFLGQVDP